MIGVLISVGLVLKSQKFTTLDFLDLVNRKAKSLSDQAMLDQDRRSPMPQALFMH